MEQDVAIARLEERAGNLERWQKDQNGHLKAIDQKLDRFQVWLIGVMGGVITSLGLLILNLVIARQ